jgi:hypothetical protein
MEIGLRAYSGNFGRHTDQEPDSTTPVASEAPLGFFALEPYPVNTLWLKFQLGRCWRRCERMTDCLPWLPGWSRTLELTE